MSRTAGPRRSRQATAAGFTLIEMLVALTIMAVVAGLSVPAFLGRSNHTDMEEARGRVEALFRLARDSAVRSANTITVTIDSASSMVWLDARVPPAAAGNAVGGDVTGTGDGLGASRRSTMTGATRPAGLLDLGVGGGGAGYRVPANGESLELPASVRLEVSRARASFSFSPSGAAQGDSVVLRSAMGERRVLTLNPWTGHVLSH